MELFVESVTFSSGAAVKLEPAAITFIVGANNAGKSQSLRDITSAVASGAGGPVVRHVVRGGGADEEAIAAWAKDHAFLAVNQAGMALNYFVPPSGAMDANLMGQPAVSTSGPLNRWAGLLVNLLGPIDRQNLVQQQPSHDPVQALPSNVLQALQSDQELEERVSKAVEVAFGDPVTLNRVAGPHLRLHVGRPTRALDIRDRSYAEEIADLPPIDLQGDGYRAYVGAVLSLLGADPRILLIDEPEAFLRPPQAKRLGEHLATHASSGSQIICATHSADVLEGALQSQKPIHVIRLRREGNVNHPTHLHNEDLAPLWADPLIRYSGALEALFAQGLVVCENERDCTFYLAALEADPSGPKHHDLEFVSVGGKGGVPRVAAALGKAGVPVKAVCDIDVLNDADALRRLLRALGHDLDDETKRDLAVTSAAIADLGVGQTVDQLRKAVDEALAGAEGEVANNTRRRLQLAAKSQSGWSVVKRSGLAPLRGDQRTAADRLLARLQRAGLFVVPVGELEAWVPQAGSKSSSWLPRALELRGHESVAVRDFVRNLVTH